MRKSKREIERDVQELASDEAADRGRPLTDEERRRFGDGVDLEAWDATPKRRAVLRSLAMAARGVEA